MTQTSFLETPPKEKVTWAPTSTAAEKRLQQFLPKAGKAYAQQRNFDFGRDDRRNVSALSPWIRHRLLLEQEVLQATLSRHSAIAAEKFIQEVFWRGYFKGWLEHRPEVWRRYKQNVVGQVERLEKDASLGRRYDEAIKGRTGIACFDAWTRELIATGYLHNHARMWFASIWIFTLRLPWELGADYFYRHLLDGDPASNTCSWRWVGGLHTKGKTYLARAENIERYTEGTFNPAGQLALEAPALIEVDLPAPTQPAFASIDIPSDQVGLVITEEDCLPETLELPCPPKTLLALRAPTQRSVLPLGEFVKAFAPNAVEDATSRAEQYFACDVNCIADDHWAASLINWSREYELDAIITARLPIGPVARRLRTAAAELKIPLIEITRRYDRTIWPHAKSGFFGLKKKIPAIFSELGFPKALLAI